MTRKDYVSIAKCLSEHWRTVSTRVAHAHGSWGNPCICQSLASVMQKENPRFDRGRFLAACIPEEDACESFSPGMKRWDGAVYCRNCSLPLSAHALGTPRQTSPRSTRSRSSGKSRSRQAATPRGDKKSTDKSGTSKRSSYREPECFACTVVGSCSKHD